MTTSYSYHRYSRDVSPEEAGVRGRVPGVDRSGLLAYNCEAITGMNYVSDVSPVIGEAIMRKEAGLSSGSWNTEALARICRESHFTAR